MEEMDEILILKKGRIVRRGTHAEPADTRGRCPTTRPDTSATWKVTPWWVPKREATGRTQPLYCGTAKRLPPGLAGTVRDRLLFDPDPAMLDV